MDDPRRESRMRDGTSDRPLDPVAVESAEQQMLAPREERRMRELLDALCDPTRVKIVRALRSDNTLAAGDLARVVGRSRSATSQHLKVLREVGVVVGRRTGNVVRYSLADDVASSVIEQACAAFDALKHDAA